jgi:hypothetical protein
VDLILGPSLFSFRTDDAGMVQARVVVTIGERGVLRTYVGLSLWYSRDESAKALAEAYTTARKQAAMVEAALPEFCR